MSCLTRMARGGEMRTTACKPSVDQKMGKLRKKSDLDGIQRNMTSSRVSSFFTKRRVVFENLPSQYKEKVCQCSYVFLLQIFKCNINYLYRMFDRC